jgi:DinB superfamily
MKRSLIIIAALTAGLLSAQDANPVSSGLKQSWNNIKTLLAKEADKMPPENYSFKPTPELQDFGTRVAHIVGANMRTCASLKGEQKTLNLTATSSKAEIAAAMKEAWDECDSAFNALTDADAHTMIAGRGGQRSKLSIAEGMLEHSQELYGYMAVYLRLKGVVPPSSDRNER